MEEPSSLTRQAKFVRRADLDKDTRLKVGVTALLFARRGTVTRLAARHALSRNFVYQLRAGVKNALDGLFEAAERSKRQEGAWLESVRLLLQLRLQGRCAVRPTADLMTDFGAPHASVGFASQTLRQLGALLPDTVRWQGSVFMACDEIFFQGRNPVLVSVDTHSLTVLKARIHPGLSKEAWQSHWSSLAQAGIETRGMTSDDGWMLRAARLEDLPDLAWQPDTFHAVSHRLGPILCRLERGAHKAIEKEYERQAFSATAAKPALKTRFGQQWAESRQKSAQAIETLENFRFLYQCILRQFDIFDRHGRLADAQKAENEVRTALELLRTLPVQGLSAELEAIAKNLPHLFNFLRHAGTIDEQLAQTLQPQTLPFWCTAWQYLKKANKSCRRPAYQAYAVRQAEDFLKLLEEHLGLDETSFAKLQQDVFDRLDQIVQSSASVETFNSFLRPFLNDSRDQLSQEMLNLIVFYYNHRVFKRGKRKGKSPFEILSGQKTHHDWLDELLLIAQKDRLN